ncbi:hypothetical protein NDU88_005888 [Pleurodeles waltl]|uniref:Uncharacterized protein n=1 Tax=Pleurodeles waltl TaxID=8319 RepID=A0AAV7SMY0_PLEWA|nr:hypothetical protein NDU88_005888 [Pleurodeles waltl]
MVLRGIAQNIITTRKKQREEKVLERCFLQLKTTWITWVSKGEEATHCLLEATRDQYQNLVTNEAGQHYLGTQRCLHSVGDKAGRLQAWLGQQEENEGWVSEMVMIDCDMAHTNVEITHAFARYYSRLYEPRGDCTDQNVSELLAEILLPALDGAIRDALKAELTLEEVGKDMQAMQLGKVPDGNGFPTELYKRFASLLHPRLLSLFTAVRGGVSTTRF